MAGLSVVIGGSYRKFWEDVLETVGEFNALGVRVLAPPATQPLDRTVKFVLFEGQEMVNVGSIEREFLEAIRQADLFYLVNPGGYIGLNLALEFGFAVAGCARKEWGGTIGAREFPQDDRVKLLFSLFDVFVGTPQETVAMIQSGRTTWY